MNVQTHANKKIHLATDHAGFVLKEEVKKWLQEKGVAVVDHGASSVNELDDFPDFIAKAAKAVSLQSANEVAIIFGGSGQGEAMVANRFRNVRATVYYGGDSKIVTLSREHNDANVLSIGARFVDVELTKKIITAWLQTSFDGSEKRVRRNRKMEQLTDIAI